MEDNQARDKRIEFIINARSDIQHTLFALCRFLRDSPEILNHPLHQQAFQLLVGAAFSLWRAIFLTEADRDWKSITSSVLQFLDKVVTDNAITYHDDKTNRAWTVGYYLTSAELRVQEARNRLIQSSVLADRMGRVVIATAVPLTESYELTLYEWQITHDALCALFQILNPEFTFIKKAFSELKEEGHQK